MARGKIWYNPRHIMKAICHIAAALLLLASPLAACAAGGDPYDYKATVQRRVAPKSVTHPIEGRSLADFGQEAFGFLEFVPPKGARGDYEVRLGEVVKKDGSVNMRPGGTIRAVRVVFRAPFEITPETVRMVAVEYPMDMAASSFSCDDDRLVKVYDICKASMRATSFAGLYVDGDRERIPYEADAYINQLGEYAVHADYSLARASHEYLMKHPTWPTEWKQHSVMMAWADWMWTGDTRSLAKFYSQLKDDKLLERFRRDDGLLETGSVRNKVSKSNPRGARDIVDWPTGERDGFVFEEVNAVVNAFYYRNLREMASIARALGKPGDAAAFAARAEKVRAAYQRAFYRASSGVYADGERTDHASLHSNAAALAFGLVPADRRARVAEYLASRGMACSVYFAQYLLEAFFEAGRPESAIALMTSRGDRSWLGMIDQGATITLEAWAPKYKPNLDLNHAWGAAPLNIISRYVLGVTPLEPGFAKIRVAPQVGALKLVEGVVPTAKGPVKVRVEGGSVLTLETPAPAEVVFGGRKVTLKAGRHVVKGGAKGK